MRRLVVALMLLSAAAVPLSAQQVGALRVGLSQGADVGAPKLQSVVPPSRSHWQTGAVIGAVVGVAAAIFAVGAGGGGSLSPSEILVLGGIGVLLGGVPGALIGALFPK
ncbi:MAG: hypothetical protein ABIR59_09975 [Gemmatimonadales bacterium]